MSKWGLLHLKMGCGEGRRGGVCKICNFLGILPFWHQEFPLCFLDLFSWAAHLAACFQVHLFLQPLLSITQLPHLLPFANRMLRKPHDTLYWIMGEWCLSWLFELREAGSWVGGKLDSRALWEQQAVPSKTGFPRENGWLISGVARKHNGRSFPPLQND